MRPGCAPRAGRGEARGSSRSGPSHLAGRHTARLVLEPLSAENTGGGLSAPGSPCPALGDRHPGSDRGHPWGRSLLGDPREGTGARQSKWGLAWGRVRSQSQAGVAFLPPPETEAPAAQLRRELPSLCAWAVAGAPLRRWPPSCHLLRSRPPVDPALPLFPHFGPSTPPTHRWRDSHPTWSAALSTVAAFPGDTNPWLELWQSPVTPPALAFTPCSSCLPLLTFLPLGLLCPPLMLGLCRPGPTSPASLSATSHLPSNVPAPGDHGPFLPFLFPTL